MAESERTLFERIARDPAGRRALAALADGDAASVLGDWRLRARGKQQAPEGDWRVWLLLAGRGFGKTRSGAEWVRGEVESGGARHVALVAPTAADARRVMVEGESGLLAVSTRQFRPRFEPSNRLLTWPNGARASLFSADRPDRLRGPQHDAAWCDELAIWRHEDAWHNLMLGLRLGLHPRCVVTTTPRPTRLLRLLVEDESVAKTVGATAENRTNLAPSFLAEMVRHYGGTRLGRQELEAEFFADPPGALWRRAMFERDGIRVSAAPALARIVVAIDPAVSSGADADETGIVVAALGEDGRGYVLADLSGRMAPFQWAARALEAYRDFAADRIVGEVNNGGEMIAATLRTLDPAAAFKAVRASRGKLVRAEPVAALYEQGRVHHVGAFPALEDQLCQFDGARSGASPDRLDALVWALSELMLAQVPGAGLLEWYRREAEARRTPEN